MLDVWKGDILLPDGTSITDIGFASPNTSYPNLAITTLHFLATVDPARVPLHLAAGPSLDVWTTCQATENWFASLLLSPHHACPKEASQDGARVWWEFGHAQSPIGILAKVDSAAQETSQPRVTEILFYGTIAPPNPPGLPTPPASSPEGLDGSTKLPEFRVHALPLSSDLLYQQAVLSSLPSSPALPATGLETKIEAQFLPPLLQSQTTAHSPKRGRDIFEEATLASKKARGKGGAGVAAAAARGRESQPSLGHRKSLSIDSRASPGPDSGPTSAHGVLSRPSSRRLSRSPSLCSDSRPLSRKGLVDSQNKRSTLSQVATVSRQPEEPTTESRNKEALSKVVMAAMRMHGLQQRKKNASRRASRAPNMEESQHLGEDISTQEAAKEEEYKLVYHQTFKGAAFALRQHISEKPLHAQPDRLRGVVESLLNIFLSDPLAQPLSTDEPANPVATPGAKQHLGIPGSTHTHASPFDLPSVSRPGIMRSKTDNQISTGSPISKRSVSESMPS